MNMPLYLQTILVLLGLVAIDCLLGILKALATGTFDLGKLPSFLETAIPTGQLLAFAATVLTASVQADGTLSATAFTTAVVTEGGALALKLVGDIVGKLTPSAPVAKPPAPTA